MIVKDLLGKAVALSEDKKQLTFLDGRFYQVSETEFVPSVTTILEAYPKDAAFYAWLKKYGEDADKIRDAAGDRGSKVHNATELLDAGVEVHLLDKNGYPQYSLQEWDMIKKYVEFRTSHPEVAIEAREFKLVSPKLGYAGTLDMLVRIDTKLYILDIKTSNMMHKSYEMQLEAYASLLEETGIKVDGVCILWLNAKTRTEKKFQGEGWQLVFIDEKERANNRELFAATKKLWEQQNKNYKPKNLTYNLVYSLTK
jgi:CRISPR/Cas system-associated exonuclease Cas4 (RecB family)